MHPEGVAAISPGSRSVPGVHGSKIQRPRRGAQPSLAATPPGSEYALCLETGGGVTEAPQPPANRCHPFGVGMGERFGPNPSIYLRCMLCGSESLASSIQGICQAKCRRLARGILRSKLENDPPMIVFPSGIRCDGKAVATDAGRDGISGHPF